MIRGWGKEMTAAAILVMSVMLGGCQAYTDISSVKAAEFDQEFKRYSIVNYAMPALSRDFVPAFQAGMLDRLTACGADAAFTSVLSRGSELSFDEVGTDEITTDEVKLRNLNPDALRVVREELPLRRGLSAVALSHFFIELSDQATQKPVWKASIELHRETKSPAEFGAVLARDLTARMVRDGLLGSCAGKHA